MSLRPALLLLAALPVLAQAPEVKRVPAKYTSPASGAEMYKAYCASCHGLSGKGDGPVAAALKTPVPDLTQLSAHHKGAFPTARVTQVIEGQVGVQSHGLPDMPVWGPVFRSLDNSKEPVARIRAANLAKHIESLQAK